MILYPILVLIVFLVLSFKRIYQLLNIDSLLTIVITFVNFFGIFQLLGLPKMLINGVAEGMVLLLFFKTYYRAKNQRRMFYAPATRLFILFTLIVLISAIINDSDLFVTYLFYRFFLTPYLFMLIVVNLKYPENQIKLFLNYVQFIFLFQIIATFIRFPFYGITENPVGTIVSFGGGVATYIPLIAAGFLLSYYYVVEKKKKYLVLLLLFQIVAVASQKRGTFVFLPIIVFLLMYFLRKLDQQHQNFNRVLKYSMFLIPLTIFIFVLGAKYNFILNPEKKVGGSFDLSYIIESQKEYVTYVAEEDNLTYGRIASLNQINNVMLKSDVLNMLFGYGTDAVKGYQRGDGKFERFGVGGTFPGISYMFIQVGILGGVLWLLVYFNYFLKLFKTVRREKDRSWKAIGIGSLILLMLFFIDYFFYSITFITIYSFTFCLAFASGLQVKRFYIQEEVLSDHRIKKVNRLDVI